MKAFFFSILFLLVTINLNAQNPIVPAGVYIADPSAHVWKDGKLYVYGSRDESPNYYCSWRHDVLSTTDLKTWTITQNVFASKGLNDQVPYNNSLLFAPDVQYKNGLYYMYYCQPDKNNTEGVATSQSPLGPFTNAQKLELNGANQIDPCVFMDDDGQAYYIWGQFQAKIGKLKPNMKEVDLATVNNSTITEKEHFFHEGAYMIKRNNIYYLIYAHMGRAGMPTCIGYATSNKPLGPFKYGGVIIDNDHSDPKNWNNHGSLVEFNKQWYVFYHRATHGSNTMRKTCIEPITFNNDGSITEVEMTTQGASNPLDALQKIDAERACLLYGNVRVEAYKTDDESLTKIVNGDKAAYKYINFGNGVESVMVAVIPGKFNGTIEVVLDNSWGPAIGVVKVDAAEKQLITLNAAIKKTTGIHAVWLRFSSEAKNAEDSFQLDWLTFSKE
jgi:beta-xylosidase